MRAHHPSIATELAAHLRLLTEATKGVRAMEDDWLERAARAALCLEEDMSLARANRLGVIRRRVSREEKARIVAECRQPGACLKMVAQRNRVPVDKLRGWIRLAGGGGLAGLGREDAAVLRSGGGR